jgi:hypothetical protein
MLLPLSIVPPISNSSSHACAALCRTLPHFAALRRTPPHSADPVTAPDLQGGVGCCVDAQLVWWGLVLCRFMALQRLAHSPIPPHCSIYFEKSSAVVCCCSLSSCPENAPLSIPSRLQLALGMLHLLLRFHALNMLLVLFQSSVLLVL